METKKDGAWSGEVLATVHGERTGSHQKGVLMGLVTSRALISKVGCSSRP